jgi:hypothetical protein
VLTWGVRLHRGVVKHAKPCIFCGIRPATSKEHFWPQWLAPHIPPAVPNSHVTEFHSGEGKQAQWLLRRSERPGALNTKKIRAVCPQCNNGWMSELEGRAKTVMLDLFKGDATGLTRESAITLARWACVKATVGEHATQETALTPREDRLTLYEKQHLPKYTRVFLAYHALTTQTAYVRHSTTVSRSFSGPQPSLPVGVSRNIQATTFLVGPLCFYVTSVRVSGLDAGVLDPPIPMIRLWPEPASDLDLAGTAPLSLEQGQSPESHVGSADCTSPSQVRRSIAAGARACDLT